MKLPKVAVSIPHVSGRVQLALAGLMLIAITCSTAMQAAQFPWNGNPFEWFKAKGLEAQGAEQRKNYHLENARRYFQQAVNVYAHDASFQFALGETEARLHNYLQAEKAFRAATL